MACKCDLKLEDKKFKLNIDLAKFKALDLDNADVVGSVKDSGFRPTPLRNLGNNIYSTINASPTFGYAAKFQEAIAQLKNSFSCACLNSKMDLIKFIIADRRDSFLLRNSRRDAGGIAPGCTPIVIIDLNNTLAYSIDEVREMLIHEVIHVMESCSPCRSQTKNDLFSEQKKLLYRQYKLIHRDIINFHKQFTKNLIDNNIIKFKEGYEEYHLSSIIDQASADIIYNYALRNDREFLATLGQSFCFAEISNDLFISPTLYTIKDPDVTPETLRALYVHQFNLRYKNLIARICELFNKIQSNQDNCDESVSSGIECSLTLSCASRILIGLSLCCNSYDIYLDIDSDAGCCSADKSDQKKNPILVGSISLLNQCQCYYRYSSNIDIQKIINFLNNCCLGNDPYSINTNSDSAKNFTEDLSNQIYNNLKNIIETNSEAKLFLNSIPCD